MEDISLEFSERTNKLFNFVFGRKERYIPPRRILQKELGYVEKDVTDYLTNESITAKVMFVKQKTPVIAFVKHN